MTKLPTIMALASDDLKLSLQRARAAISHKPSGGGALEEAVRVFLRQHLHPGLGVTQGQVVDTDGNVSKQLDVIVYDAHSTPMLFTSAAEGYQLVPIEGVIGVVEVKARISATDIPGVIANMQSIKSMRKRAYHRRVTPRVISTDYSMFGQNLDHFPVIYSLFAFESSSMDNLVPAFREHNDQCPVTERVDNTCLLDKGVLANATPTGQLDAIPNPETISSGLLTQHALLTWYIMIQRLYSQAESEPISMQAYLGSDFVF